MTGPAIRKQVVLVEEISHDGGPPRDPPLRKGAVAAIIANPFAGRYEADLLPWMESLRPLAVQMTHRLIAALGGEQADIQSFGKGAIVGVEGELEQAAVWHAPGGHGMKSVLSAKGFVTAGQIMGSIGAPLHIPLVHIHSPWVRSHFDAVDIAIADAPRPREIVFALAMSCGPRIHSRLGGLTTEEVAQGKGPSF